MATPISMRKTESLGTSALSLLLIGPDEQRRRAVAAVFDGAQGSVLRELVSYPSVDETTDLIRAGYDAVLIDLDDNPEVAIDVIENFCATNSQLTVMAYSARANPDLLVRCMRAGAREFLTEPVASGVAAEALVRAAARKDEIRRQETKLGKLFVFAGTKGGCGVTTLASNFAVSLAKHGKTILVDLDLDLGDAALTLGVTTPFTVLDALNNLARLDADFLEGLLARHASGLALLSAPDQVSEHSPNLKGLDPLIRLARENFEYVVIDSGSRAADVRQKLFEMATSVYLITQFSVVDLRNANRLVARYFDGPDREKLQVVVNRVNRREVEIDEAAITRAITCPAKWHVPNDFVAAQRAQNLGVPLVQEKTSISRAIGDMASAAAGGHGLVERKKKFSFLGL